MQQKEGCNLVLLQEGTIKCTKPFACTISRSEAPQKSLPMPFLSCSYMKNFMDSRDPLFLLGMYKSLYIKSSYIHAYTLSAAAITRLSWDLGVMRDQYFILLQLHCIMGTSMSALWTPFKLFEHVLSLILSQ